MCRYWRIVLGTVAAIHGESAEEGGNSSQHRQNTGPVRMCTSFLPVSDETCVGVDDHDVPRQYQVQMNGENATD